MILNAKYKCIWYILDNSYRLLLGISYYIFGLVGLLLNIWLASAFLQSPLLNSTRSHLLLLNLCVACLGRVVLAGFPFAGTSALVGRWVFGEPCCQLFGFLKQMLGVFQMFAIMVIAFERYLIARKKQKSEEMPFTFYICCMVFCWLVSVICSVPPLFHVGSYRCDITGAACDLDWRMTHNRQIFFNISILIFVGVCPVLITWWCLWKANHKTNQAGQTYAQKTLTKTIIVVSIGMFILWTPQAIQILWIITGIGRAPRIFPVSLAVLAPLCTEATAMIPVLSYLAYDERIRAALLNMVSSTRRTRSLIR